MKTLKKPTLKILRIPMILLFSAITSISTIAFAEILQLTEKETFATPLQAVIAGNPFIDDSELARITLSQELSSLEQPDLVKITLIQSGFLDDSLEGTKEIYYLKKQDDNRWFINEKIFLKKCRRGNNTIDYQAENCL